MLQARTKESNQAQSKHDSVDCSNNTHNEAYPFRDRAPGIHRSLDKSKTMPVQSKVISKQVTVIPLAKIVVPSWYPKKYISTEEMENAKSLISDGKLGWENIVVRYVASPSGDKYYELIRGLVSFRAHQEIGRSEVECELVDDERLNKGEAIIASLSYNCFSPLNHWESTITGLSYLVEELKLTNQELWYQVPGIGTRQKKTISQTQRAISKCNMMLSKRKYELKLRNPEESYFEKIKEEVTPEVERAIEKMLGAIGIDLTTFVQKRIPLTKLPRNITSALSSGKLHYSKAIALSRVGSTNQIKALVDVLHDVDVINAIVKEQSDLLSKTLEDKWTNTKLNEEIILANNRILMIGTNEDDNSLSLDEIGNRKETKEDLKLQADVVSTLTRCRAKLNNFKFITSLTDREKSQFQMKIKSLNHLLIDLDRKVKARAE